MPKSGIDEPIHILTHKSHLHFALQELQQKISCIPECCESVGTKPEINKKPLIEFNHSIKESIMFFETYSKRKAFISAIPTIYINLEKRPYRNTQIQKELAQLGIHKHNVKRFNAVEHKHGAIGCAFSHIKCLEWAIQSDHDYVFICEDDLEIVDVDILQQNLYFFLHSSREWDVLLVAGNNMLPYKPVNHYCIQVMNCITTTGYIVKKHYYNTLLRNFKEGVLSLMKHPDQKKTYAIDKYWLQLQMVDKWFLLIPPSVVQREDYSDIEHKVVNFKQYMLNYNKVIK